SSESSRHRRATRGRQWTVRRVPRRSTQPLPERIHNESSSENPLLEELRGAWVLALTEPEGRLRADFTVGVVFREVDQSIDRLGLMPLRQHEHIVVAQLTRVQTRVQREQVA